MLEYYEDYGTDADGNRGVKVHYYDLDEGDKDDIEDQLIEILYANGQLRSVETVSLYSYLKSDFISVEVNTFEYLSKTQYDIMVKELNQWRSI